MFMLKDGKDDIWNEKNIINSVNTYQTLVIEARIIG